MSVSKTYWNSPPEDAPKITIINVDHQSRVLDKKRGEVSKKIHDIGLKQRHK